MTLALVGRRTDDLGLACAQSIKPTRMLRSVVKQDANCLESAKRK